jgi:hypothetical protein
VIGLPESAPRGSRGRRLIASHRRWLAIAAILVAAVVAGRAGLNELIEVDVSREAVEKGGARALLSAGGGGATLTCPGGLEPETGATIVCTYVDTVAEAVRSAAVLSLENVPPPKPKVGRVEIRISGWHTRGIYPGSTSEPKFAARVIHPPR